MIRKGLSYDDVLLVPQYSNIDSRSSIDISSPMDTVSESEMAVAMYRAGGAAVIHRYNTINEQLRQAKIAMTKCNDQYYNVTIGGAVGVVGIGTSIIIFFPIFFYSFPHLCRGAEKLFKILFLWAYIAPLLH